MSRMKLIVAVFAATVAVSAMVSTTALAGWMVNGTNLPAGSKAALASKAITIANPKLVSGILSIECTGVEGDGAEIIGAEKGLAIGVVFTGCESKTPLCPLGSKEISTVPVLITQITLDGALATQGVFEPHGAPTKNIFATFKIEGEECSIKGIQAISGKARFLAPEGQDERTDQTVLLFSTNNELKSGLGEAKLHGLGALLLASHQAWSYL